VGTLSINANDASGEAEIGSAVHLKLTEQIAIWLAGAVAQEVFNCPGHELAAFEDQEAIMELLEKHAVSEQEEGPALRAEAWEIAATRLNANRTKVIALVDRLVQRGGVDAHEFRRLMDHQ
jgi:hypothetical protein